MNRQRLLVHAQSLARLKSLPDSLLHLLLSQSDPVPEHVPQGVILFRQGEHIQDWYLLLAGEVQLYLGPFDANCPSKALAVVRPGTLFGEFQLGQCHSCSGRVLKSAQFVRINQTHFLTLYNKWADQLQPCILLMEDLTIGTTNAIGNGNGIVEQQRKVSRQLPRSPSERRRNRQSKEGQTARHSAEGINANGHRDEQLKYERAVHHHNNSNTGHGGVSKRLLENGKQRRGNGIGSRSDRRQLQLLELNNGTTASATMPSSAAEKHLHAAAIQLREAMPTGTGHQINGSEFSANLHVLWVQLFGQQPSGPLATRCVGQALLDHALLVPTSEHHAQFSNSVASLYRWTLPTNSNGEHCEDVHHQQQQNGLVDSLLMLLNEGSDCLLQSILRKPEEQRTEEELEMVQEEISYIRAFNHLSRGMKRGIARVLRWEGPEHAGTVIFREGDPAKSWFVVLRGTLEAKANGKKSLLREGDDFGKLALLNGNNNASNGHGSNRRQATVITTQDGCQLLRVDAADFQRILCEVEADTIRLKQPMKEGTMQQDVLVLQRDPKGRHSLVAGQPEKIIEYVLETRAELGVGEELLEEVLLTLPHWMPSNRLCDALKIYYASGSLGCPDAEMEWPLADSSTIAEHGLMAKRRVVQLVVAWQQLLGCRFFLDPVANSFVEELFSCLMEDAQMEVIGRLDATLAQMQGILALREEAMQRLSRAPRLVLDCGTYSANAPAPSPVLSCDFCNQAVLLPDSSQITITFH